MSAAETTPERRAHRTLAWGGAPIGPATDLMHRPADGGAPRLRQVAGHSSPSPTEQSGSLHLKSKCCEYFTESIFTIFLLLREWDSSF